MTSWLASSSPIPLTGMAVAGMALLSADARRSATLGLIVADADGQVHAITAAAICDDGASPLLDCASGRVAIGRPCSLFADAEEADGAVESLLVLVPIPASLLVDPIVPGLANLHGLLKPHEAHGKKLIVAGESFPPLSRYGKTMSARDEAGQLKFFSNAIEIPASGRTLRSGSAGALVSTADGYVVGLVVGATDKSIYAAPLAEVLKDQDLVPLDWRTAARHELLSAGQRQEHEDTESSEGTTFQFEDDFSDVPVITIPSNTILERYDPERIVKEVERRVFADDPA